LAEKVLSLEEFINDEARGHAMELAQHESLEATAMAWQAEKAEQRAAV
jgi:hypothetical protein